MFGLGFWGRAGRVRGEYWVYNRCILGFLCMFIRFLWGLCKVYAVYTVCCIFIGGTVYRLFHRSPLRGSGGRSAAGGLLVGFAAAAGGVGSGGLNLKKSRCFKLVEKSLKIGGILHFFGVFGGLKSLRLVHLFTHN